jgi:hypothetical protein
MQHGFCSASREKNIAPYPLAPWTAFVECGDESDLADNFSSCVRSRRLHIQSTWTSLARLRDTQPATHCQHCKSFFFFVKIRAEEALGRCGCACAAPCVSSPTKAQPSRGSDTAAATPQNGKAEELSDLRRGLDRGSRRGSEQASVSCMAWPV